MTTRPASSADAWAIAQLLASLGKQLEAADVVFRLEAARYAGTEVILAEAEPGSVAGLAAWYWAFDFAEGARLCRLISLVVHPGPQGQGVGQALVETVERRARDASCAVIEVTASRRQAASTLYPDLGYHDACSHHARFVKRLVPR